MKWWRRFLQKKQMEKRLQDELQFHLERQVSDYVRAGMSEQEARRKAHLQFGGIEGVKEECREARGTLWAESILSDVRFALRMLRKSPGFTVTVISTLALGIGANAAIFQLLDAVRLRSLPVKNPQELALIQIKGNKGFGVMDDFDDLTYPLWEQIRQHQRAFSGVFAWAPNNFWIGSPSQPRPTPGLEVSGDLFPVLGVAPWKGRLFTRNDDYPGCGLTGVVISYSLWQNEFGGQNSAIGSKLSISGRAVEVIGVTPPQFSGLEIGRAFDVAIPFCSVPALFPRDNSLTRRDNFWIKVMGRLKPGWTLGTASAQLRAISPGLMEATTPIGYQSSDLNVYRKFRLAAYPGEKGVSSLRRVYDTSLWLLLVMTGLILLIACANLANLMLARGSAREREMSVRLALGASRWRLIYQLLCEGLVLAFSGAVLGGFLANVFSKALILLLSTNQGTVHLDLRVDWRILAFLLVVAIGACLLFELAPMLRISQTEPGMVIRSGGRGMTAGRERFTFQKILIASQMSVSLVLLVGALLFVRSFRNLITLDPGFHDDGILLTSVSLSSLHMPPERSEAIRHGLEEQIRTIPQVQSIATSTHVPLDGSSWTLGVQVGEKKSDSKFTWVSPQYFQTLQMPLLAGRDFTNRDTRGAQPVAIVNQTFVRKFLRGANPLGQTLRTIAEPGYPETEYQIVGIVKDAKYESLREKIPPQSFAPATQTPLGEEPWVNLFIRFSSKPSAVISAIRQKVGEISPELVPEFQMFHTGVQNGLVRERLMALLSGFFGALAVLLAAIGLYGVVSYLVLKRKNEVGIRMALGANRYDVIGMMLRQALMLAGIGVFFGIPLALALGQSARSLLFGMPPYDPATLLGAVGFLIVVSVLASFLPAWRAARLSPMTALREEQY